MRCRLPPVLTILLAALLFAHATAADAACSGRNLIAALDPGARAALHRAVAGVPYAQGLFWRADKGDARIVLIGTYHLDDPRHDATVARFGPDIAAAGALLVEAGPREEARLTRALRDDPSLMSDPAGPSLATQLGPGDWQRLAGALEARGVPAPLGAHLRPWYVATLLGLSPCMLRDAPAGAAGLDQRLIAVAEADDTPVIALEPWDTLFTVFGSATEAEQLDMIRAALPQAEQADDYATTMLDAYFDQDVWILWEFGRHEARARSGLPGPRIDRQLTLIQTELMDKRNRAWIAPIEAAAADAAATRRPVVAAFGALHLPGRNGVLALLARNGWQVSRID